MGVGEADSGAPVALSELQTAPLGRAGGGFADGQAEKGGKGEGEEVRDVVTSGSETLDRLIKWREGGEAHYISTDLLLQIRSEFEVSLSRARRQMPKPAAEPDPQQAAPEGDAA